MADFATPDLPSADFDRTEAFYQPLGFETTYRADDWMILNRGELMTEFFRAPIDPNESWLGTCFRVDDFDDLHAQFLATGLSQNPQNIPRVGAIVTELSGIRIFYLGVPH